MMDFRWRGAIPGIAGRQCNPGGDVGDARLSALVLPHPGSSHHVGRSAVQIQQSGRNPPFCGHQPAVSVWITLPKCGRSCSWSVANDKGVHIRDATAIPCSTRLRDHIQEFLMDRSGPGFPLRRPRAFPVGYRQDGNGQSAWTSQSAHQRFHLDGGSAAHGTASRTPVAPHGAAPGTSRTRSAPSYQGRRCRDGTHNNRRGCRAPGGTMAASHSSTNSHSRATIS